VPKGDIPGGSKALNHSSAWQAKKAQLRQAVEDPLLLALLAAGSYDFATTNRGTSVAREQRRLAAIMAVDVVGYSRLMGRDKSGKHKVPLTR